MAERKTIQLPLGGMNSSGAPAMIGENETRFMQNVISTAPGQWEKRPPLVDDSMTGIRGLMLWDDLTNQQQRLVALQVTAPGFDLRVKDTSGEGWGAAVSGTNVDGLLTSHTNYKGVLYYTIGNTGSTPTPAGLFSYNGASVNTRPLGGESLYSYTIASFIDRLILGYVKASVVNQLGTTVAYDPTSWTATTTVTTTITNGSTVVGRIIPTATTLSKIEKADVYTVAASTTDTVLNFRSDLRNTSPTYEMPMTTEIYYSEVWTTATAYTVGAIRVATSGAAAGAQLLRFRCTVAGTSGAGEPVWPTTVGGTVVDGGVTWIADGKKEIASQPVTLPTLTENENFITTWAVGTAPPNPSAAKVGVRIKFGHSAVSTIELAGVDISIKDGAADGVKTKANKGQQLTVGKFYYPFFNQESSATAAMDLDNDLYWTETSDPNTIRGSNYYILRDMPGKITAMAVVAGRLVVFKKRGMWVFQGSSDPDNPLIRERFYGNVGCVGPIAWTVFEDKLYFISEDEVFSWETGGEPKPLCGNGMREEVVANSLTLPSYPCLAIDPIRRHLYVRSKNDSPDTTKSVYVYQIDRKEWSIGVRFTATNGEIGPFIWNPKTKQLYIGAIVGLGDVNVRRLDFASAATDFGTTNIASYTTFRPIETFFPRREFYLEELGIYHSCTGSQTNNTFEVQVSLDGGNTFTKTNAPVIPTLAADTISDRFPVSLRQLGQRLVVRLYHTGAGGATMFNISAVDAVVRDVGPQRNLTLPTQGSATL